jgi:hypothetical protein
MKKRLIENPIKRYARQMLREGNIEEAEASLAAKDISDRIQDMVENVGKMVNDELPKLVDKIRATYGQEQAVTYQQSANGLLSELLSTLTEKKSALEQAVLVLTGDAQAEQGGPKTDLDLADDTSGEQMGDEETPDLDDFSPDSGKKAPPAPLGRAPRLPAAESRAFNKKLSEAKIIALKQALDETDERKFPVRARRLAEELKKVAIQAIKEAAREVNVKKTSKEMMKPVSKKKIEETAKKEDRNANAVAKQMTKSHGISRKQTQKIADNWSKDKKPTKK